jgi:hypothetical protein
LAGRMSMRIAPSDITCKAKRSRQKQDQAVTGKLP